MSAREYIIALTPEHAERAARAVRWKVISQRTYKRPNGTIVECVNSVNEAISMRLGATVWLTPSFNKRADFDEIYNAAVYQRQFALHPRWWGPDPYDKEAVSAAERKDRAHSRGSGSSKSVRKRARSRRG